MSGLARSALVRMILLACAMILLWLAAAYRPMTPAEEALWERVRAAQHDLAAWKAGRGAAADPATEPWECGLIGVEWSSITTTLGDLEAKRTACHPSWAVQFSRWYQRLELQPGDTVAIYSSASFPGLLLSAVAAAEANRLQPLMVVSLGASTWGANQADYPWPVLAARLREQGFIRAHAVAYTLGGEAEMAVGMAPEGVAALRHAADQTGVPLLAADGLEAMVQTKAGLMTQQTARLFVNIGGSHANLGSDDRVLGLKPGLHIELPGDQGGNGVLGRAFKEGIPVLHLLNIRSLANEVGIPFDSAPRRQAPGSANPWWALSGLLLFFLVLFTHRRWRLVSR